MQRSQPLLGTFVVISVRSADKAGAKQAITLAFTEVRRLDEILSLHRPDSELVNLNRRGAEEPIAVSRELFTVIARAQEIAVATDGCFDITIRKLADLWGFISKEQRLPHPDDVAAALSNGNFRAVFLNEAERTVHFQKPGLSIDLGAIAKGYIVDRALEVLREQGFTNALVRAGGDLRASGSASDQDGWPIQIEDPNRQGERTQIRLHDLAISTSGDYENYLQVGGKRYGHILDPRTGWPVQGVRSCSVMSRTAIEADALATAFFVLGPERALARFGEKYRMRFVLEDGGLISNF